MPPDCAQHTNCAKSTLPLTIAALLIFLVVCTLDYTIIASFSPVERAARQPLQEESVLPAKAGNQTRDFPSGFPFLRE